MVIPRLREIISIVRKALINRGLLIMAETFEMLDRGGLLLATFHSRWYRCSFYVLCRQSSLVEGSILIEYCLTR